MPGHKTTVISCGKNSYFMGSFFYIAQSHDPSYKGCGMSQHWSQNSVGDGYTGIF